MRKRNPNTKVKHDLYRTWVNMKQRCNNPNATSYHLYGGKGVKVCPSWDTFDQFLLDMGERPDGCSLDRIDSNGNYEPGNCRWADKVTQSRNNGRSPRRRCLITFNGITQNAKAWGEEYNINPQTLRWRISKGWDVEQALTIKDARPGRSGNKRVTDHK